MHVLLQILIGLILPLAFRNNHTLQQFLMKSSHPIWFLCIKLLSEDLISPSNNKCITEFRFLSQYSVTFPRLYSRSLIVSNTFWKALQ